MSHRRAIFLTAIILLIGFGLRVWGVVAVPGGFSEEELTGIRVTETIRAGTIFVFFPNEDGGIESLYYALAVTLTRFTGDGLLGYRLLSLWGSLLTLALLFTVARRLFGLPVGLLALTTATLGLWPTFLARTATHHSLLPLLVLAVLWAATQAYYLRQRVYVRVPVTLSYTLLGIAIALVVYAHPTGFLAGLAVFLFAFQIGRGHPQLARDMWWNTGYALLMALILGIPYIISVLRNLDISGPYLFWAQRPANLVAFLESCLATVGAFFWRGDTNPAHNVPGLPLTQLLEPVFLLIGLGVTWQRRHQPNYFLLLIIFGLGLLPDMWLDGGPDFRLLSFVLPGMYMLIGIGIVTTLQTARSANSLPAVLRRFQTRLTRFGPWPRPLVGLTVLLLVVGYSTNVYLARTRLLHDWPQRPDTRFAYNTNLGHVALYLDTAQAATPILVCTSSFAPVPLDDFTQPLSETRILEWMLHREDLSYRIADCNRDLVFIDGGRQPQYILFTDPTDLNVLPSPLLSWFRQAQTQPANVAPGEPLTIWQLDGRAALAATLADLQSQDLIRYPRGADGNRTLAAPPLDFESNLTLLAVEPPPAEPFYRPGDILTLTTYWQVRDTLSPDIGVFIRLHDIPQASPYTEINGLNADPQRLQPGDVVVQVGLLTLPSQLRPAEYVLTLGVYNGLTVNQQRVYDAQTQRPRGTYILIDYPLRVQAP